MIAGDRRGRHRERPRRLPRRRLDRLMPVRLIGLPTDSHSSFLRGAAAGPGGDPRRARLGSLQCGQRKRPRARHRHRRRGYGRSAARRGCGRSRPDRRSHPRRRRGRRSADLARRRPYGDRPDRRRAGQRSTDRSTSSISTPIPISTTIIEGDPLSHASPFARIMEAGHARRLVQFGIRTLNAHCRAQAERFGVEIVEMRDFAPERVPIPEAPLYISDRPRRLRPGLRAGRRPPRAGRAERPRVPPGAAPRARRLSSAPTSSS